MNWLAVAVAALIPLVVRAGWYHSSVFGGVWQRSAGIPAEKTRWTSWPVQYGLSLVFALLIAAVLLPMVIHQLHVQSILMADPSFGQEGGAADLFLKSFVAEHGSKFRSWGHGALHGAIAGLLLATPLIASTALFERRGYRYVLVHGGYWTASLALMGTVICGWA